MGVRSLSAMPSLGLLVLAACSAQQATVGSASAPPTPNASIVTLTDEEALDPGTYRIDLDQVAGTESVYPSLLITLPDGWNHGGWLVNKPTGDHQVPPISVQFWDVEEIYAHPCQWNGTLMPPGPTVDDLAAALAAIPDRDGTDPVDVTLGEYSGKYLELSVPEDQAYDDADNAVGCDRSDGVADFRSWTGDGMASVRYHQGAGQLDRLWIMDIDGSRIVIDAFEMPYATADDRAELTQVVESIRFES
jgi:hypothetical protein